MDDLKIVALGDGWVIVVNSEGELITLVVSY